MDTQLDTPTGGEMSDQNSRADAAARARGMKAGDYLLDGWGAMWQLRANGAWRVIAIGDASDYALGGTDYTLDEIADDRAPLVFIPASWAALR